MNTSLSSSRKRAAEQAHRRDLRWQIIVPMAVVLLLVIGASVAVTLAPAASASRWADISIIWILFPVMFFSALGLLFLLALIYGMAKLLKITPIYAEKLTLLVRLTGLKIEKLAETSTKPIFFVESLSASFKHILKK